MHVRTPVIAPPTKFELNNALRINAGYNHLLEFGTLPDNPFWNQMEFRKDLNDARFSAYHPNISNLIDLDRQEVVVPPDRPWPPVDTPVVPPHNPVGVPCVPIPPDDHCTNPQIVPEPASYALLFVGILVLFAGSTLGIWSREGRS